MTLRYVQVTQADLQREFHLARQLVSQLHPLPTIAVPTRVDRPDIAGICQAIAATRHLLDMFRRQMGDDKARRRLQRLDRRLFAIASQLDHIFKNEK